MLPLMTSRPSRARRFLSIAVVACSLASPGVFAEWRGGIEGGTVVRDGGNATRLGLRLANDERPLTHSLYADWLNYERGNGYRVGYLPRYWFDEALYLFGEAEGRVDRPLAIDRGLLLLGGVGYRVFDSAVAGLGIELGGGARSTRFEPSVGAAEGVEESEGLGLARVSAFRELADLVRLELDAETLQGARLGELRAEAALAYRVAGGAIRLGYRVRRLSFEEADTLTDEETSVTFAYGF